MRDRWLLWSCLGMAGCVASAGDPPDRLVLRSGDVLEGRLVGYADSHYGIEVDGEVRQIAIGDIEQVEGQPLQAGVGASAGRRPLELGSSGSGVALNIGLMQASLDLDRTTDHDVVQHVGVRLGAALGIGGYSLSSGAIGTYIAGFARVGQRPFAKVEGASGPGVMFHPSSGRPIGMWMGGLYFVLGESGPVNFRVGGMAGVPLPGQRSSYAVGWFPDISAGLAF